ncbi:helix-turn-helix domain-containing protein [Salinimicrobium xinjiangense]|uniref:helix-turn-helix domain-containing protein n=1 Tax=Salinimicrobium xinjiangense TaxID=438596 RepID=UPI00041ECACD|nr:helix-turn-helix transcriptional regulator [Salinimicrobium xinjiangense]
MNKKEEAIEKLQSIVKPDPGAWKKEVQWRNENKTWIRKSQKIAFRILRALREQKKTQKELAAMMKVSPQQVNKWVKGKENFTLETLSRIEEALEIDLLAIEIHEEN